MTAPALSERDLAVLRSFARRIDASDAGAHNNLGVLYYQKGLVPEAIQAFTRALELDPKMQVAQRNLEIAYHHTGFYDRRVAELKERLRAGPDDRDARWELGRAYAILGQFDQAVEEFEELLAHRPKDVAAIIQLGLAEKNRGRPEVATEWFQRAQEIEPTSSVVHFYLGEIYYNRGLNDAALSALQRAVELNPDNANAHYLMAFVLGDMGRHQEARGASKRAIALNPPLARAQTNLSLERYNAERKSQQTRLREQPEPQVAEGSALAHYNLGLAFRQKGYYVEAQREYRLALERGEDRRLVLQAMAEVHLLRRDFAAGLELYDTLLREVPDSPKLWNERGVVLHQMGKSGDALASYRQAVEVDAKYGIAWNNVGVVLAHQGDTENAIEAFRTALQQQPGFVAARLNLALLLFHLRRFQLSLEAYRQVLAETPDSGPAWNGVGLVLVELKRFPDARNAFVRAVEADPNHAGAHYNLSFTLSNLGDFEGALREVRRALELDPYYTAQKFLLSIELQADDPSLSVIPDLSGEQQFGESGEAFVFDQRLLDNIFTELKPAPASGSRPAGKSEDPFALARDYLSKALFDRAVAEATRAVQRGADKTEGAALLGAIYEKRGLFGEALERYREAKAQVAMHKPSRVGEVRVLLALQRGAEARPLAELLLATFTDDVDVALLVAEARSATGDPSGAIQVLRRAEERSPARADVRKLMGDVALKVGDTDLARRSWLAALDLDPGYVEVWLESGRLAEDKGDVREAERSYRNALERLPSFHEAAHALASLYAAHERLPDALDLLIGTLERDPYDFEALVILARVLLDLNRAADAIAAAQRVVAFRPEHGAAHYQLGVALARERRYREAVQQWERCIAIDPSGPLAAKARTHARTAMDLVHIFAGEAA